MPSHLADNADHWRQRAGELRRLADIMSRAQQKEKILELAEDYDRLAFCAEERRKTREDQKAGAPFRIQ